jgi:hypothetical protein
MMWAIFIVVSILLIVLATRRTARIAAASKQMLFDAMTPQEKGQVITAEKERVNERVMRRERIRSYIWLVGLLSIIAVLVYGFMSGGQP